MPIWAVYFISVSFSKLSLSSNIKLSFGKWYSRVLGKAGKICRTAVDIFRYIGRCVEIRRRPQTPQTAFGVECSYLECKSSKLIYYNYLLGAGYLE